ncbi:MAG: glycosyl hydrolase family 18 protein [Reichenbachiella sp.]
MRIFTILIEVFLVLTLFSCSIDGIKGQLMSSSADESSDAFVDSEISSSASVESTDSSFEPFHSSVSKESVESSELYESSDAKVDLSSELSSESSDTQTYSSSNLHQSSFEEESSSSLSNTPSSDDGVFSSFSVSKPRFKNIGYLTTWADFDGMSAQTDFSLFTHVNIAFANPSMDGIFTTDVSKNSILTMVEKAHAAQCKVLISIGGAAVELSTWLHRLSNENRASTVSSLVSFVREHNLDGVDVDLEGDLVTSEWYNPFVTALSAALLDDELLTAAVGTYNANSITDATVRLFDFINAMTYDARGPWRPNEPGQHSTYEFALSDIAYWKGRGLEQSKIVLGVPFYGWNFDKAGVPEMAYKDIVTTYPGAEEKDAIGQLYYNGQPTIEAKTLLALQEAGGIMNWDMSLDIEYSDSRSLLRTIVNTIEDFK